MTQFCHNFAISEKNVRGGPPGNFPKFPGFIFRFHGWKHWFSRNLKKCKFPENAKKCQNPEIRKKMPKNAQNRPFRTAGPKKKLSQNGQKLANFWPTCVTPLYSPPGGGGGTRFSINNYRDQFFSTGPHFLHWKPLCTKKCCAYTIYVIPVFAEGVFFGV